MLRRDEWRWWPLAPWLLWQGLDARRRVPRLPPAPDPGGREAGVLPPYRLLGIGDSTIAGIGCGSQREAVTGALAARCAARDGRAVDWLAHGLSGATAATVRAELLDAALDAFPAPDLVLLSVGVNDAVRGRAPGDFAADLVAIVATLGARAPAARVLYAGMPPVGSFPALRPPLAELLRHRAVALQAAAGAALAGRALAIEFPAALAADAFAPDGFHPGPAGCATWADWLVARL